MRLPTQSRSAQQAAKAAHLVPGFRAQHGLPVEPQHSAHLRTAQQVHRDTLVCRAVAEKTEPLAPDDRADKGGQPPDAPPERKVSVDIKTVQLDGVTTLYQCLCSDHLRYEAEYGLKRGTTSNLYLLKDGNEGLLIDVPRKEYLDVFCNEIGKEGCTISCIAITHLNPDIVGTLAAVVRSINTPADAPLLLRMSNPARAVLESKLNDSGCEILGDESKVKIEVVKEDTTIVFGRRELQCFAASTPRYPELLCLYERTTRRLFSSCFFSAHVNPQAGARGTDGTDHGGWAEFGADWRFFFDCMFAPVVTQAAKAIDKLDLSMKATGTAGSAGAGLLRKLSNMLSGDKQEGAEGDKKEGVISRRGSRPVAMILPRHGPVIRQSVTQLLREYDGWIAQQEQNLKNARIAVLYASAYGNTAALAQAISRGVTKAGVGVETVNLEQAELQEAEAVIRESQGFVIGSPTLGGHMPTQVSKALGSIITTEANKTLPCGVYGSFGWSGEAVDKLHERLNDAGFKHAFKPIKVKFRPTAKDLQVCEESGTDLAQQVLKSKKTQQKQSEKRTASSIKSEASDAAKAMGRVVGSLSVVTCKDGDAESAMLASWISQASFDPPGLTVAVKRDRAVESLLVKGNSFNVNILKEGTEGGVMKALLKEFAPGEDRFGGVEHHRADNECVVLEDAVSCLQCRVSQRMDAGDHYIVYGEVDAGEVLDSGAVSAVHHRKSGNTY